MKRIIITSVIIIVALGIIFLCSIYLNPGSSEVNKLAKRAEADFCTNVLPSFPTAFSHQYYGYLSVDTKTVGHIFEFELHDTSGVYRVNMNYKWIPEVKEWGYAGWKLYVHKNNNTP